MGVIFTLTDDVINDLDCYGGIYQIINLNNNKAYIGSSCNIKRRLSEHLSALKHKRHHNYLLLQDFIQGDCFIFSILENIDDSKNLQVRERYHKSISQHSLYNILKHSKKINIDRSLFPSFFNNIDYERGCWIWTGSIFKGYGRFGKFMAHRIMYAIYYNEDPGDLLVRHKCNNKKCINPHHLVLGSDQDNHRDRTIDGIGKFKLTYEISVFIKLLYKRGLSSRIIKDVINLYYPSCNINIKLINSVLSNRSWNIHSEKNIDRKTKVSQDAIDYIRNAQLHISNEEIRKSLLEHFNISCTSANIYSIRNNLSHIDPFYIPKNRSCFRGKLTELQKQEVMYLVNNGVKYQAIIEHIQTKYGILITPSAITHIKKSQ